MRVRFTDTVVGPGRTAQRGHVADIPDDEARLWINAGVAVAVEQEQETATAAHAAEVAMKQYMPRRRIRGTQSQ